MLKTKYLCATVLVALFAVLCVGTAYAQDHWAVATEYDEDAEEDVEIKDFPSAMVWDETAGVSFDALNDGATTWDTDYDFRSVEGVTPTLTLVNRWGLTYTPATGVSPPVAPGDDPYSLAFNIVAPPISTLAYVAPVGATDPGVLADLECDWTLANMGTLVTGSGLCESDIGITRFVDTGPGTDGEWAAFYIEECAGRVPYIVQGFPDGLYRPRITLSRDAMAVFMRRAMKIPQIIPDSAVWDEDAEAWTTSNTFPDVPFNDGSDPPDIHWAVGDIEALVDAGVVEGYPDGLYHPDWFITRAQMAVFVARAKDYELARDDDGVSTLEDNVFPDVAPDFWAGPEIQACVDDGVVEGYPYLDPDTDEIAYRLYQPTWTLSRDQIAVFTYRAFVQATAAAVVLAGPATTNIDPSLVAYVGVSSADLDPALAYVGFDAVRMGTALAFGGTWNIEFRYLEDVGPTIAGSVNISVTPGEITAARTAAMASGVPYYYVVSAVPSLTSGPYTLVVLVEDDTGTMHELPRTVGLYSSAAPPPPGCPVVPDADDPSVHPDAWVDSSSRSALSGFLGDMAEDDGIYYVTGITPGVYPCPGDDWTYGEGETLVWNDVPADALALRVTLDYHVVPFDQEPGGNSYTSCCGGSPGCTMWGSPEPGATDNPYGWGLQMVYWADFWAGTTWGGEADVQAADAPFGQYYGNPVGTDQTFVWETTNVSDYINVDGDVAISWCGVCGANLYIDKLTLEYALPPEPRIPDADDPSVHPDSWVDSSSRAALSGFLGDMAENDGAYYVTGITPGIYPCPGDDWTYGEGETLVWNDVPADAVDLTVVLDYHVVPFDQEPGGNSYTSCCGGSPGCTMWGSPEPGATDNPYGWGLQMVYWADFWAGTAWGGEADIQAADAPFGQYYGNPVGTDQTFTWTTTNVSDYVNVDGDVAISWCGVCGANLYIDQLTLNYTPNPLAPVVYPGDLLP